MQVGSDGNPVPVECSHYVWIPTEITCDAKFKLSPDLCPTILLPLPQANKITDLLKEMLKLLKTCTRHNFPYAVLAVGGFIQSFHFKSIIKLRQERHKERV